jgi:hypothetical protein
MNVPEVYLVVTIYKGLEFLFMINLVSVMFTSEKLINIFSDETMALLS